MPEGVAARLRARLERWWSRRVQRELAALRDKPVNYDPEGPHPESEGWRVDDYCAALPPEPPGPPVEHGPFEIATQLLRDYRVADPSMVVAHYDHETRLEGRNMLLELRYMGLRVLVGTRVGPVTDERRTEDGRLVRIWGWPYQTLEGHVEQGEMSWEVWKWLDSGEVQFRIHSYSRLVGSRNPFVIIGLKLIGQRQRRKYLQSACARIARLTEEALEGRHPAAEGSGVR